MTTYQTDAEGKFIPASQRPDGTWRKARRVKDGYVPQEEVPLYESKGKQYAKRQTGIPPGMCPIMAEAIRIEREAEERKKARKLKKEASAAAAAASGVNNSTSNKPKANNVPGVLVVKSENGAKATSSGGNEKSKKSKKATNASSKTKTNSSNKTSNTNAAAPAPNTLAKDLEDKLRLQDNEDENDYQGQAQQDLSKQLKKLRKKIREIENIQERMKSGELKKPDKDQLEKVKRKKEFMKEIEELENTIKGMPGTSASASLADNPASNHLQ